MYAVNKDGTGYRAVGSADELDPDTEVLRDAPPAVDQAASAARDIRAKRQQLLTMCDWTQLPDAPLSAEQVQAWRQYRDALRDVPEQAEFPESIAWPTSPAQS